MRAIVNDAHTLFRAALQSVQADSLFTRADVQGWAGRSLDSFRNIRVVGAGKASMAMAVELEKVFSGCRWAGNVVVPYGYRELLPMPERITVSEARHPVPDASGVRAAQQALQIARACGEDDLLLVLLSGGGSALWAAPAEGVTLGDMQKINHALLLSGATIHQINTVRRHLSRIKGGRLARAAYPATVLTLVISDVTGDDLSVIASGPTVPDISTHAEAIAVLQSFGLWDSVPEEVCCALLRGTETPKEDETCFLRAKTVLLGSNSDALRAARSEARRLGYRAIIRDENISGEAREVGRAIAQETLRSPKGAQCLLWGGETTVTVTGSGQGGRNQEVVLAALLTLEGTARPIAVLSVGTDGIDGASPAAGAWATNKTAQRARKQGLSPEERLANNDSYGFFEQMGSSLVTGPTHTNVMDIMLTLTGDQKCS